MQLPPPAWKGCPGPGTLPYKERKALQPVPVILVLEHLPLPQAGNLSCLGICLLGPQACPHLLKSQTHVRERVSFTCSKKGVHAPSPCLTLGCGVRPAWTTVEDGCQLLKLLFVLVFNGESIVPSRACVSSLSWRIPHLQTMQWVDTLVLLLLVEATGVTCSNKLP